MSKKVLEIVGVSKNYKNRNVLNDLSFSVYAGEIFGFIGPNGAGKSTLIRIICGMTEPTKGDVFICGLSIQNDFEKAILNVGAMVENCQVYNYMTGYQNLSYYASLYKGIDHADIDTVVEIVGMTTRIHDKVKTYSYGMKQRIALAQALLHHPRLLVLDEPTNGLDANGIIELRRTLKLLAAKTNMAIFVSSHILAEMEQLCDTVAIFDRGKILELRTMEDMQNAGGENRISIKVDYPNYACKIIANAFEIKPELAGNCVLIPNNKELLPAIINALKKSNVNDFETKVQNKNLEDIYLDILKNIKNRNL